MIIAIHEFEGCPRGWGRWGQREGGYGRQRRAPEPSRFLRVVRGICRVLPDVTTIRCRGPPLAAAKGSDICSLDFVGPAQASGANRARPWVVASARWAVPKASLT